MTNEMLRLNKALTELKQAVLLPYYSACNWLLKHVTNLLRSE